MVECSDGHTSSLEAKRFEEGGGDDSVESRTEISIKEYLHQSYIQREFCIWTADFEDSEALLEGSQITNPESTFDFTTDYENLELGNPFRPNEQTCQVWTMYKSKAKKVQPVDEADGIGDPPGGRDDWYERSKARDTPQQQVGEYQHLLLPRFSAIPRGTRLTSERLASLDVGDMLLPEERVLFDEMMLNREGVISFEWPECGRFHQDVSPPVVLKTIPHKAWQAPNFLLPQVLVPEVMKMI